MQDVSSLPERIRNALAHEDDILFAYLYGSATLTEPPSRGDVDIAIYLNPSTAEHYLRREVDLTGILISALRATNIDLRILNVLPLVLQYEVLKEGKLILCRDDLERVDFETRVMLRFFELKPYIDEYRGLLIEKIGAVG